MARINAGKYQAHRYLPKIETGDKIHMAKPL